MLILSMTNKSAKDPQIEYLIGMSHPNLSEEWQIIVHEEMKNEADKIDNLSIIFTNAGSSTYKQIKDIKMLMEYGIDLLIITVNDVNVLGPLLNEINEQIPVIVLDRDVSHYDFTLFIGPDYYSIGKKAGERVVDLLGKEGGEVVEIRGPLEEPSVVDMSHGFNHIINQYSNINLVSSFSCEWLRSQSEEKMDELLQQTKEFDIVFAHNNAMALGAYYTSKAENIDVTCIGVSGLMSNQYESYIKEDILNTTFLCPIGGKEAVDYAIDILSGEDDIPKKIILNTIPITKENVNSIENQPKQQTNIKLGYIDAELSNNVNFEMFNSPFEQENIELFYKTIDNNVPIQEQQEMQIEIIKELINDDVDIIALSPVVSTGWDDILIKAKKENIPIILLGNEVNSKEHLWSTYIGSDYYDQGKLAARYLVNNVYNTEADMVISELRGHEALASTIQRSEGFNQIINGYSRINIDYKVEMDYSILDGKKSMTRILKQSDGKVNVVFAHDKDIALGAIHAIEEDGLTPGEDVIIVTTYNSYDTVSNDLKISCQVQSIPIKQKRLLKVIKDYMEGKQLPKKVISRDKVIMNE